METIRNEIWAVDPDLPVDRVRTMNQIMRRTNWEPTLFVSLFGIFSILALILASIGVYGIIAYGVEQRRGEFGIRMALGASHGQIETLVVRQGLRLMAAGLGIGLAAAWVLMRLARTIFFGVHPNDPLIYILMTVAMGSVALTASWLPVRRALKIDPVRILQAE